MSLKQEVTSRVARKFLGRIHGSRCSRTRRVSFCRVYSARELPKHLFAITTSPKIPAFLRIQFWQR